MSTVGRLGRMRRLVRADGRGTAIAGGAGGVLAGMIFSARALDALAFGWRALLAVTASIAVLWLVVSLRAGRAAAGSQRRYDDARSSCHRLDSR